MAEYDQLSVLRTGLKSRPSHGFEIRPPERLLVNGIEPLRFHDGEHFYHFTSTLLLVNLILTTTYGTN